VTGATGAQGATGATGISTSSASAYTATATVDEATFFVVCPAGQIALGGGGSESASGQAAIVDSSPTDASGNPLTGNGVAHGWIVTFAQSNFEPTVWVICSP
jgi:hypothetical protein